MLLIRGAMITDGSGAASYKGSVVVEAGMIRQIIRDGESLDEIKADQVIDAEGMDLTPGFIDMHSHADLTIFMYPDAENMIGQGVTTVFSGHCGMGVAPLGRFFKTQTDDLYMLESVLPLVSVSSFPGVTPVVTEEMLREAFRRYKNMEITWTTFGEYLSYLEKTGISLNIVEEVGLQQIRQQVLGPDSERPATDAEIETMKALLREAMDHGARGMSIGYDYTPDMFASEKELDALAEVVKEYDGMLTAHTRSGKDDDPDFTGYEGILEYLEIGARTGVRVHISHIHPGEMFTENKTEEIAKSTEKVLEAIEDYRNRGVRVTWDVLHRTASSIYYEPELCAPFMYYILTAGSKEAFRKQLEDPTYRSAFVKRIAKGENIKFPRFNADLPIMDCKVESYIGKSVRELAEAAGKDLYEMLTDILIEDIDTLIRVKQPHERIFFGDGFWLREEASIGTDNGVQNYDYEARREGLPHARGTTTAYSGFIQFLKDSEEAGVSFEKTIRKLTGNAAEVLGLKKRGRIEEGFAADLVLMNRKELKTNEDFKDPRQQPSGIEYVLVNGEIAAEHGVHRHIRSGKVLRFRGSEEYGNE